MIVGNFFGGRILRTFFESMSILEYIGEKVIRFLEEVCRKIED